MILKKITIDHFRAMKNLEVRIGKSITAVVGRNTTMKTTLLGMLSQPFSISKGHALYGEKTIEGYNYRSQFKEKFKLSSEHDKAGEHLWKLTFRKRIYNELDYIWVKSVTRKSKDNKETLRFINAEKGKVKGHGYVQVPVVYLSLSRLYPIGESGKTKNYEINLSDDENELFIRWYKKVLSIHNLDNPIVSTEKKDSKVIFSGINDNHHTIETSSAGESNVGRILMAILSFRRLQLKYPGDYIGGILLIDELDATLHGFSQRKIVELLSEVSKEYRIQVIFTTHSPIVLKRVNSLQRNEVQQKKCKNTTQFDFDNQIVYLQPNYDDKGHRNIQAKNVVSSKELREVLDDIELRTSNVNQQIRLYCEDNRSQELLEHIFKYRNIKIQDYVEIVEIDLGWTNYCQLVNKGVPEFTNSLIVLDHDVESKPKNREQKAALGNNNVLLLPVDVEKGMFDFLKEHRAFNQYQKLLEKNNISSFSYEACFSDWPEKFYEDGNEYKHWFQKLMDTVGELDCLYHYWCSENEGIVDAFISELTNAYNALAAEQELDFLL